VRCGLVVARLPDRDESESLGRKQYQRGRAVENEAWWHMAEEA